MWGRDKFRELGEVRYETPRSEKWHIRRYWYYYVPALIIALAAVLIILFLVIIPTIVQGQVNKNPLIVYSARFSTPTQNTIEISLLSSFETPSGVTTRLKDLPLNLTGATNKTPFTKVVLAETDLRGKTPLQITGQTAQILDETAFEDFLQNAMYSTNFTVRVNGKTNAFLGAIKAPINFDKTITMPGLQNLTGFRLADLRLLTTPLANGTNLLGTAVIPNLSLVTLEIGSLFLNLAAENISIGTATLDNVVLTPGTNNVPLHSTINLGAITSNVALISNAQPGFASNGTLSITANNRMAMFNGSRLAYFEKVLNPLFLPADVNVRQLLAGATRGNSSTSTVRAKGKLQESWAAGRSAVIVRGPVLGRRNPWI